MIDVDVEVRFLYGLLRRSHDCIHKSTTVAGEFSAGSLDMTELYSALPEATNVGVSFLLLSLFLLF